MTEVRAYECMLIGTEHSRTIYALNASKARYKYLLYLRDVCDGFRFQDISARSLGGGKRSDSLRREAEAFKNTAESRGLPFARIGMKVECGGRAGVIAGKNDSANFQVVFANSQEASCHPRWKMRYFNPDGSLIWDSEKVSA